ncbi:unnamed protein product [Lymnaea stagnalis]|uniref:Uncharacterized protein n=1 Tax=Lymnaea stagnalis TaxID=6523 RepID=A0AAV2IEE6_LYMST
MKTMLCLVVVLIGAVHIAQSLPALGTCTLGIVNCFVEPCRFSKCAVEGATCGDDYCGGCNARWYVGGKEVTSQCAAVAEA